MLTLTPTASEAVHALLDNADLPKGCGVRFESEAAMDGSPGIGIHVVATPADDDLRVPAGDGHDLYLSREIEPMLTNQILDAEVDADYVAFSLHPQSGR
jgi:hypothetical protein